MNEELVEEWKTIEGYNGIYQASSFGNIRSLNYNRTGISRLLKLTIGTNGKAHNKDKGYFQVNLYCNGIGCCKRVHVLVAEAFLGHNRSETGLLINHIDINTFNNRVDNLEIIANRENTNKKHLPHSSEYTGVSWHKNRKKWQSQIIDKGKSKYLGLYKLEIEASKAYELEREKISKEEV